MRDQGVFCTCQCHSTPKGTRIVHAVACCYVCQTCGKGIPKPNFVKHSKECKDRRDKEIGLLRFANPRRK